MIELFLSLIFGILTARNGVFAVSFFLLVYLQRKEKSLRWLFLFFLLGYLSIALRDILSNFPISSGIVTVSKENYFLFYSKGNLYYVSQYAHSYEVGDILRIQGEGKELAFHAIESHFDFQEYLTNYGVKKEFSSLEIAVVFKTPFRFQAWMTSFLSKLPEDSKHLIEVFWLGKVEKEVKNWNSYSDLGYLFAPSGIYFSFLFRMGDKLFQKKKWAGILFFIFLTPCFLLVFLRFSFFRSLSFFLFKKLSRKYQVSYLELISLWGMGILFLSPYYLFQISFYYPYLFIFFAHFVLPLFPKKKRKYGFPIFIELIRWFSKKQISFTNSLFRTIFLPFFLFGMFLSLVAFYFPFLPCGAYLDALKKLSYLFARYDGTLAQTTSIFLPIICIFLIFYLFFLFFHLKRFQKKMLWTIFLFTFLSCGKGFTPPYAVYFIDIGQGNATLIKAKNQAVLVDTGGSLYDDLAWTSLLPFFRKQHIYELDAVIISHDDYDHSGALSSLEKNFPIHTILSSPKDFPYEKEELHIENLNLGGYESKNENSLVLFFHLHGVRFLIMGDASKKVEKEILHRYSTLQTDYILLGHHGSNTSSAKEFLKQVSPKCAMISVGDQNRFGHPSEETLKTLKELQIPYRRTDEEGTISIIL